jgi:FkbM family methyltransferase
MIMLGVTSLSTFLLVFKTSEEWPQWSDDGEAAEADEGVRLRTLEESPLPSPPLSSPPLLKTLTLVGARNKSTSSKPTLYVLTTGVRHFQAPQAFTTTTVMGQEQTATVGPIFDEGYGPRQWPEGAKQVVDGHVTVWRKIAAECSGWCFVSEDDAIWPNGIPSELPSDGFVSFFKEAVCGQAKGVYSENYDSVVKAVIPGKCMPYGAVAYAITGEFAKMLLSNLPMSKPVDHFLWEQAVVQKKAYVSRQYVVRHKKGKSLRQNTVQHPPPNADTPTPLQLTCSNFESSVNTRWTKNTCTKHSFDMAVHSIPDIVSDRIVSSGCWEKDIITQIVQHLGNQRSGHTKLFLDIGANIGAFTSTIASLGHEVIAVEPFKLNVPLIRATMCRHNLNIHLYKVGLADTSPGKKMCIWSTNDQINNVNARMTPYFEGIKDFGADKQKKCMEVIQTYTLDELLFETYKLNRPIDAMKIDIEGFETRAFRGAKKLLASKFKPKKIWFEFQKQATIESGVSATELFQTLVDNGYNIIDFRKSDIPLTLVQWNRIQTGDFVAELQESVNGVKSSKSSLKIAVAIPTYNRAGYVQLCAAALNKTIDPNDVWIFDDHSTEYTAGDVQKWFRSHSVQRNAKRFKADKQARHILEWFVGTDYDWLITLDSDLIVRPDWLELLRGMLPHTQGVMSLYHSGNPNHPTLHCDPNLCEMKSLGNAGVAWSKVLAKRMLVDMTQSDGFDWGWTEWLQKQKIPQYAAKDSLVLHVGMHGTWGADSKREKSVGFPMDKLSPDVRGRAELFLKGASEEDA